MSEKSIESARHAVAGPQAGIANRPPEHLLVIGLGFTAGRAPGDNRAGMERLRALLRAELRSDIENLTVGADKTTAFVETGELGFADHFDRTHLTITLGIGRSGMTALGLADGDANLPQDLVDIPWAQLGDAPAVLQSGDIVLQICADSPYVTEHVARRVQNSLAADFQLAYALAGQQRYTSRAGRVARAEARALIGFHDGVSNLDPTDAQDQTLIYVDPDQVASYPANPQPNEGPYAGGTFPFPADLRGVPGREPEWTRGGTYMVVRGSVFGTVAFDETALGDQEHAIGRFKLSGAPLDLSDDPANLGHEPAFAANQGDLTVPVDAHIRKANPRRDATDAARRLFRRGYPMMLADGSTYRRGLVFLAFARSTSTQFEFIVRAWMRNVDFPQAGAGQDSLMHFEDQVLAGGYYFVPALDHARQPWTWRLPPAPAG